MKLMDIYPEIEAYIDGLEINLDRDGERYVDTYFYFEHDGWFVSGNISAKADFIEDGDDYNLPRTTIIDHAIMDIQIDDAEYLAPDADEPEYVPDDAELKELEKRLQDFLGHGWVDITRSWGWNLN